MGKGGAVPSAVCVHFLPFSSAGIKILITGHDSRVVTGALSWVWGGPFLWDAGCPPEGVFIHLDMFLGS